MIYQSILCPHDSSKTNHYAHLPVPRQRRKILHPSNIRHHTLLLRNWPTHQTRPRLDCLRNIGPNKGHKPKRRHAHVLSQCPSKRRPPLSRQQHDPHLWIGIHIPCLTKITFLRLLNITSSATTQPNIQTQCTMHAYKSCATWPITSCPQTNKPKQVAYSWPPNVHTPYGSPSSKSAIRIIQSSRSSTLTTRLLREYLHQPCTKNSENILTCFFTG